jgi:hypothetical protein
MFLILSQTPAFIVDKILLRDPTDLDYLCHDQPDPLGENIIGRHKVAGVFR